MDVFHDFLYYDLSFANNIALNHRERWIESTDQFSGALVTIDVIMMWFGTVMLSHATLSFGRLLGLAIAK